MGSYSQTEIDNEIRTTVKKAASGYGGISALARKMGVQEKSFYDQIYRTRGMLVRTLIQMIEETGDISVLQLVAKKCNCVIYHIPKIEKQNGNAAHILLRIGQAFVDASCVLLDSISNNGKRKSRQTWDKEINDKLYRVATESFAGWIGSNDGGRG